jgi:uncharacterized membrane protein
MISLHWLWLISCLAGMVTIIVVASLSPGLSRPDIFFCVTVDPSLRASAEGRKIVRQFQRDLFLFTLPSWVLVLMAGFPGTYALIFYLMFGPAIFLELAGVVAAYIQARRRACVYAVAPSVEREAVVAPRKTEMPGGWLAQLGPLVILGAACFYLWLHWNDIPNRFPIHWGIDGRVNGWARKTVGAALAVPASGVVLCILLTTIFSGIAGSARRVFNWGKKGEEESTFVRRVLWLGLGLEYGLSLIFGYLTLLPLPSHLPLPLLIAGEVVLEFGFIIALLVVAIKTGQGRRSSAEGKPGVPPVGDRTPDRCWKGGLIYYNPDDPALWVEKRFGVGWTTNFGHPGAWFILGGFLFLGILPFVLMRWF